MKKIANYILIFALFLVIQYKTGKHRHRVVDSIKINYPTAIMKIGHHRKYIDLRMVRQILTLEGKTIYTNE